MATNEAALTSSYSEQDKSHWRYVSQGTRWTTLGVALMAVAMLLFLLYSITLQLITTPRNPGAMRMPGVASNETISMILTFAGLGCTLLGFLATVIGLALCCFAPRPALARLLALGSLILFVLSHSSIGRSLLLQFNLSQRGGPGSFWMYGPESFSLYFLAFSEYFLSIVFGICFLLAVADEFRERELGRSAQSFLLQLFIVPAILLAVGLVLALIANSSNQSASWMPITIVALLAFMYCWMSFLLMKLLMRANVTIRSQTDPFYRPPHQPLPQAVIDPLAD